MINCCAKYCFDCATKRQIRAIYQQFFGRSGYNTRTKQNCPWIMKKFIRHAGSNTNITMTMSIQRQICT